MKVSTCWTTRDEFVTAVGVVAAEITMPRTGVRFVTKFTLVAERIVQLAKSAGTKYLHTTTDAGLHVITVKGFYTR